MQKSILKMEKSKIEPCNNIIIKDPLYDKDTWCAFHADNCSRFTHAKALVSNYDEHYKDDDFEMDLNNVEFLMVLGTEEFVSRIDPCTEKDGSISVYSSLSKVKLEKSKTEIGCDYAQFSFGNENTFGAFSIHTGADGHIGEVHFYTDKETQTPVGLFFVGCVDGDMVSPTEIMDSFKAAFGIDRIQERSLRDKIESANQEKAHQETNKKNEISSDKSCIEKQQ